MVATDNGTRGEAGGRGGRLSLRSTALAALGLAAFPARAQEASAHPPEARIVVLARVAAKTPPIIFGAVDKPLLLVFDGEVGKGVIRAPGVTIHRAAPNALVLTPSRTAARAPVLVTVPLQTGMATFTLALKPEATDQQVQVYRSEEPAPLAQRRPLIGPM